jgi:diguanylate cyclase (GGDEF)-like protein
MRKHLIRLSRGFSIRQRFLVAPLLGLVVCTVLTGTFIYEIRRQNEVFSAITERNLREFNHYSAVFVNLMEQHTNLNDLFYAAAKIDEATLYDQAKQHIYKLQDAVEELEQSLPRVSKDSNPEFAAVRSELWDEAQAYSQGVTAAVGMVTVNLALVPDQLTRADVRFIAMNRAFVKLLHMEGRVINSEIGEAVAQSQIRSMAIALIGVSIAALLFFLSRLLSRLLSRSIEVQIGILTDLGTEAGARSPIDGRDEVDRMTQAIVAFRTSLLDLREGERRIKRLNRVYAVLSGINALIVRARDRDELFREACRIAVEHGQFKAASIGIIDREAMEVRPAASAGAVEGLLAALRPRLSLRGDEPEGQGVVARAIREKKAVVVNDVEHDSRILRTGECIERGIHSMVILPLLVAGEAVGVLALFADERDFFDDEEEMKLLTELGDDISFALDHIEQEKRLNHLAYYDELTGLANRTLFAERVAQYVRSADSGGQKLAVLHLDLERFKSINDSLGRPAGDALLRQVAQWLTHNVGDSNLVARLGADHFAVVLPEARQEGDVARLLEKSMEAFLKHPFRLNDGVFRIAARVGVAIFPGDGANADTLLKNAEAALKKAKAGGDRYLFYTQKMTETVAARLTLENQLRRALDNEEFVLHYQPKVNLASGKLAGAEALIRWNDPRTGLVPPGRFIPILEETGLIHDVGRWALRKAVEDYLRWRAAGLPAVRIAVNVSPLQLRDRGFVDEVRDSVGIGAHAAAGLELEITESLIMADVKHSIDSLQAIRALGVSIAIDDFGTGFSSLSYLAKLPVDALKIDRSFVIDMTASPAGLALVSTIVSLAHSLKLKVVAEGVETEEQSRLLRQLNCDETQGYLFSKPVPSEIFETRFLAPLALGEHPELRAA